MNTFMAIITLKRAFDAELAALLPKEGEIMAGWAASGRLSNAWQRKDMSGAFLVLQAPDRVAVEAMLGSLPLHPYMNTEIVEIQVPGAS